MSIRKTNPFISIANSYVVDAPEPSNISYFWNFGSLLGTCLVIQLATGIFLAMHYSSNLDLAFNSVQHIMLDVNYGWLIRFAHANGAGFFFIFVYLHMARGIYYGSYRKPRIALWTIGVIIFLLMIITAFMGKLNNSPKSNIIKKWNNNSFKCRYYSTNNNKSKYSTDLTDSNQVINEILDKSNLKIWWQDLNNESIQLDINKTLKNKAGIYIIINKITKNYYIGSAIYNRFYTKFRNHLFHSNGNKIIAKSIKKYGINNFIFGILDYIDINKYQNKYDKEINYELLYLESSYISLLMPKYNIITEASHLLGYKYNEESLNKMKIAFPNERQQLLKQLQTSYNNHNLIYNKSKLLYLYNENKEYICEFNNINKTANYLCCSIKTIKRAINKGYIYIPNSFIHYLNNDNINQYNSIKNISELNDNTMKSGLLLLKDKTKYIISYYKW